MGETFDTVCAWCTAPASGRAERVSHGICLGCPMSFLTKLPKAYLASIAEPDGTVSLFSGYRLDVETGLPR